jgi:hypothetical protein
MCSIHIPLIPPTGETRYEKRDKEKEAQAEVDAAKAYPGFWEAVDTNDANGPDYWEWRVGLPDPRGGGDDVRRRRGY